MRSFTNPERDGAVSHYFFGDKEGHTMVYVEPAKDSWAPRYEATENDIVETPVGKISPKSDALFLNKHTPPKLEYLTSTAPHQVPGAIAAAALDAKSRWGELPKPSSNLSSFSLPLVQKFSDLGLVSKKDVPKEKSNPLDRTTAVRRENENRFALRQHDASTRKTHPVLGAEDKDNMLYKRGRSVMREMLRSRRVSPNANPQQFSQDQLPGVNWSDY